MTLSPTPESVTLLEGAGEALPRMLEAIRRARHVVHLEVYRFARDAVGEEFRAALSQASRRGVRVSVVLDGWGTPLNGRWLAAVLPDDWCRVRTDHSLAALLRGRLRRSHRQILIVDGEVAFLGGVDISAERPGGTGRARGELAVEVRGPAAACLERRLRGSRDRPLHARVNIWLSELRGGRSMVGREPEALGAARGEILAAYSDSLPDRRHVRSLAAAARRGVRVTLLLSGPGEVPPARAPTVRLYRKLLGAGVEVREWTRSVPRAKVTVVDGRRLLVGGFAGDALAPRGLDSLVDAHDSRLAAAGRAWVQERLADSRPVDLREVRRRQPAEGAVPAGLLPAVARSAQWVGQLLARR
ncbi:MAG TPA: phospholipase D-like domain-containing protein [Anaeromyxobacteraceae bacterium]|nr:phospholipase D-like domain-containing protein [Anaeromyxobacteraceae bacterium]